MYYEANGWQRAGLQRRALSCIPGSLSSSQRGKCKALPVPCVWKPQRAAGEATRLCPFFASGSTTSSQRDRQTATCKALPAPCIWKPRQEAGVADGSGEGCAVPLPDEVPTDRQRTAGRAGKCLIIRCSLLPKFGNIVCNEANGWQRAGQQCFARSLHLEAPQVTREATRWRRVRLCPFLCM